MTKRVAARRATAGRKTPTVKFPKIATVLRVKNEGKYIRGAIESLLPLGGEIVVLDDGSIDDTADIVRSFDNVVYERQDDLEMDEGRDRTRLYRIALDLEPEWIFTLDGDEMLDGPSAERLLRAINFCPDDVNVFEMFMVVMASSPENRRPMRYGGGSPHGYWSMDRAFRVRDADRDYEFVSNFENNLHCGCVPLIKNRKKVKLNAWIRYYGYESEECIERKREFYKKHDPVNFPSVERMWRERAKMGKIPLSGVLDCREMGITRTMTY